MLETILSILAAIITIIFAGLLVKKQNKFHKIAEELNSEIKNDLGNAVINYKTITGEEPAVYTIDCLEQKVQELDKRINDVTTSNHNSYERRKKRGKSKKNSTDD